MYTFTGYSCALTDLSKDKISPWGWASGFARNNPKDALLMKKEQPMFTASVSKMITAAAVLKALEDSPVSLDDKIWPFFPIWKAHSLFKSLSFRRCLQYQTGIARGMPGGDSYSGIAPVLSFVTTGGYGSDTIPAMLPDEKNAISQTYNNISYAWFRMAFLYMTGTSEVKKFANSTFANSPENWHVMVAWWYRDWIASRILTADGADTSPFGIEDHPPVAYLDTKPKRLQESRTYLLTHCTIRRVLLAVSVWA
jgi:hypothetical protein